MNNLENVGEISFKCEKHKTQKQYTPFGFICVKCYNENLQELKKEHTQKQPRNYWNGKSVVYDTDYKLIPHIIKEHALDEDLILEYLNEKEKNAITELTEAELNDLHNFLGVKE